MDSLFSLKGYARDGGYHLYEPMPDDQRFIMLKRELPPGRLVFVAGWRTEAAAR